MIHELAKVVIDVDKNHFFHEFLLLSLERRPWRWVIVLFRHCDLNLLRSRSIAILSLQPFEPSRFIRLDTCGQH